MKRDYKKSVKDCLEVVNPKIASDLPISLPVEMIQAVDVVRREVEVFHKWQDQEKLVGSRGPELPLLVTCDWHIPHTSPEWMEKLRQAQLKRKVKNLVINGDFLDQPSTSRFVNLGPPVFLEDELDIGGKIISHLLTYFDKIYIILGNHDMNLLKFLGKKSEGFFSKKYAKILFGEMVNPSLFDIRVFVTNLKWCETSNGQWLIGHPDKYSTTGSVIPVKTAQKFTKNVICGHGHHLAMAYTDSGKYLGIDGGGMFDSQSMIYKQLSLDLHPEFNNGFVFLNEKGEAKLYGEGLE